MTLKEIKSASLSELLYAQGQAILSQGDGANFSQMLENRIAAIEKEISKRGECKKTVEQDISHQIKVNTKGLIEEILGCNDKMGIMKIPLSSLYNIMRMAAQRAAELGDKKMIGYMVRLGLYEFSDPYSKEYDPKRANEYVEATK